MAAPAIGQDLKELQATEIEGQFLDPAGKPLQEYDYLKPGQKYRLMPGAKIELSTLDGKYTYRATGPGIFSFLKPGPVTLNGKPIIPSALRTSLQDVTATGAHSRQLGGIAMRSREGVQVEARTAEGGTKTLRLYSGYYALVVGCGAYNKGWPRLPNPVQDAREIAEMLEQMGWDVNLLLDPDWAPLRKALNSLITGPGRDKDKAILVWFSGHGHTLAEADGSDLGYIVPVDAPDPDRDEMGFMERAISMREIETVARRIQSKHVMMVFDSCFSGAIFQLSRAKPPPFIQEKVARPVRQFLTAGNKDEKVPDKSLFKTVFVQGVRDLDADRNRDGYVTGQELGAYLQEEVVNYSRKAQHPQYGKINNPKLDKGDFVLVAKHLSSSKPLRTAVQDKPRTLERGGVTPRPKIVAERPIVGKVSVRSNVDGAIFTLAGQSFKTKSNTALIVGDVPVGEHTVVASKEGYPQWRGRVAVQPNQTASVSINLGPKAGAADISEGKEIQETLKSWQNAWNKRDSKALLALFTDEAQIMTKTRKGVLTLSKGNFARIIKKKLRGMEKRGFKIKTEKVKSINIQGDKAKAELLYQAIISRQGGYHGRMGMPGREPESKAKVMGYFELVKRGSRWLISDYKFNML
jgi:uncharacterized caspase-like protein/ketosteroid isomerase-like protein